jgi:signal transduction histidine kinase
MRWPSGHDRHVIAAGFEVAAIVLTMLVVGVYWGPWLALTRSIATFEAPVFLAVVNRLNLNLATAMTVLLPLSLASILGVIVTTFGDWLSFGLAVVAFLLMVVTLIVTLAIEVPIVQRIVTWSEQSMPDDWQAQRDRWVSFHLARVIPGLLAIVCLAAAAAF